ncbi:MAG: 2-C-methyl-D-erythritol 4-phosphate cytidylyltransferase [Thermodesulfobacteriota bacterium]
MKSVAIIPSAGMGRRMGKMKKPLIPLSNSPVLAHTLLPFERSPLIDAIILVVPNDDREMYRKEIVAASGFRKVIDVASGGAERQDSVRAALDALADSWDIIVVHDGARPFVTVDLIERAVKEAMKGGAAIAAVPVKDTIKEVANGKVTRTVPRDGLWSVQTPQAFRAEVLREAHERAVEDSFSGTDDAALVERLGHAVSIVEGSYENIKITTPEDIVVGEAILRAREGEE